MKSKSIFEQVAETWKEQENSFFFNQNESDDFFELELVGNKKTGDQIKNWISPAVKNMNILFENWDKKSELKIEIPKFGSVNDFHDLLKDNNIPKELPEIGQMELFKSSKFTDFIKGSFLEQYGLLINDITRQLITKFNIGKYNTFKFQATQNENNSINYFFLVNDASIENFIDFKKSNFYAQKGLLEFDTREKVEFNSLDEIKNFRKLNQDNEVYVFASEIFLTNNFPDYDLFKLNIFGINGIFISKKLKEELSKSTGVIIKTTKRLKKQSPQ
ncbi:hypothetical protein [Flavobacterium sp.]|uniref:hypothetical protein n=1 Tax=Flavobacterium sp. TaxID=239 RepID=UPI0035270DCC